MQGLLSSQTTSPLGIQVPPTQVSPVVHWSPSSQGPSWTVYTQPVLSSQASAVHGFPSSQSVGLDPRHTPPEQVSSALHGFPSSHGLSSWVVEQPVKESQSWDVQGFPSSQSVGPPA